MDRSLRHLLQGALSAFTLFPPAPPLERLRRLRPNPAEEALRDAWVEVGGALRNAMTRVRDEGGTLGSDIPNGASRPALESAARLRWRGQSLAFAIGMATLAASVAAALSGHDSVGIALAVGSLVGVVAAFLGHRLAFAVSPRGDGA